MDSYWGNASDPLSLNLYTYCANNPILYIDPSGHVMEYSYGGGGGYGGSLSGGFSRSISKTLSKGAATAVFLIDNDENAELINQITIIEDTPEPYVFPREEPEGKWVLSYSLNPSPFL